MELADPHKRETGYFQSLSCLIHRNSMPFSVISCPDALQTYPPRASEIPLDSQQDSFRLYQKCKRFVVSHLLPRGQICDQRGPVRDCDHQPSLRPLPPPLLRALYHKRWGIETSFRDLKCTLALTPFHAQKRPFIEQKIFAKMTLYNFAPLIRLHAVLRNRRASISTASTPLLSRTLHGNFRLVSFPLP